MICHTSDVGFLKPRRPIFAYRSLVGTHSTCSLGYGLGADTGSNSSPVNCVFNKVKFIQQRSIIVGDCEHKVIGKVI